MSEVESSGTSPACKRMEYVNQGRIWRGKGGAEMEIKTMSRLHCRRAAQVLLRQHADLFQRVHAELFQMAHFLGGGDLVGREREMYFRERSDMRGGSRAWIRRKPLMRALNQRAAGRGKEGRGDA